MHECPHCHAEIGARALSQQAMFARYRICPSCNGKFTVDRATKYRQIAGIVLAMLSLVLSLLLIFDDRAWLGLAVSSYLALGVMIYWGNKRLFFVPY